MKRALRAILIAGKDAREEVLSERKRITIREGHRDYSKGPVILCCHLLNWAKMRKIESVRHTTLREVTIDEYKDDGYDTKSEMLEDLSKFYPDINWDSEVTVIRWY